MTIENPALLAVILVLAAALFFVGVAVLRRGRPQAQVADTAGSLLQQQITRLAEQISQLGSQIPKEVGAALNLDEEMTQLTLEITGETLFGVDLRTQIAWLAETAEVLRETFIREFLAVVPLPDWLPLPSKRRMRRAIRNLDTFITGIIRDRRASGEDKGDLLSMLVHAQDADDGARMTARQVRDEVMTIFMAGHETTAVALSWTWYLLAQHPDVDARLADELRDVLGGRAPSVADLPRLPYTGMVVTESMRLYPPAYAIGRQAARATEIAGQSIAPGDIFVAPTWVVHRDHRWFEEPETFRPERWAGDFAQRLPRYAYFPFGGGPRQCIGNGFAMMETVLLLATIAQRFRLAMVPGQTVTPTPYVTLRPEPGIRMRLEPR
jgi:cytochrome P450